MKKLIVVTVLFSLSLCANAYVQNCYYGRTFVQGEWVNTCKKCECKKCAKKAHKKGNRKAQKDALAAKQATTSCRKSNKYRLVFIFILS